MKRIPDLDSIYHLGGEASVQCLGDENLGGWFRNITRSIGKAFSQVVSVVNTGARAVAGGVRTVAQTAAAQIKYADPSRYMPKEVKTFAGKTARYVGATAFTIGTAGFAGGARNKIFGLKGGEITGFDVGAKLGKYVGAAVAVVATGGAASTYFAATGATAALAATAAGMGAAEAAIAASFLSAAQKDPALARVGIWFSKDMMKKKIFAFVQQHGGGFLIRALNKEDAPDLYEEMPDGSMTAGDVPEDVQVGIPSYVAGTSYMSPDSGEQMEPAYEGQPRQYGPAPFLAQRPALPPSPAENELAPGGGDGGNLELRLERAVRKIEKMRRG